MPSRDRETASEEIKLLNEKKLFIAKKLKEKESLNATARGF